MDLHGLVGHAKRGLGAKQLAMEASARASLPATIWRAVASISARAALNCVAMSASMCCIAWNSPIARPNWRRCSA
jgi:hypothetical protein